MATVPNLKKQLKAAGVEFGKKDLKAALEALVAGLSAAPAEVPAEVPQKSGPDSTPIKIDIQITLQDGSIAKQELSIINPGGCIKRSQLKNVDRIQSMVRQGLINAYGVQHIKG